MRYVVIDQTKTDLFNTECETQEEALQEAEKQFDYLTDYDKKQRTAFFVLESANPDEEAEDHFDGTPIKVFI